MRKANSRIGLVGVVFLALANVATTRAQSDELPRRLREKASRQAVDDGFPSVAAAFDTEVKITASDGAGGDWFGGSVAISGDTMVVASRFGDGNEERSGAAYVYQRDEGGLDNWSEVTRIFASDGAANDGFGWSVAISGDTVIVGAKDDDRHGFNSGSAYVYRRDEGGPNTWGQLTKIDASDGADFDGFGNSVALDGDTAIVGAWMNGVGAAYIRQKDRFGVDNWGEVTKIGPSTGIPSTRNFGTSVAISGDTVIVGVRRHAVDGTNSGAAFVFRRDEGGSDNWGEVAKIIPSDGIEFAHFGEAVAINGDMAIVGAVGDDVNGDLSGSAYLYRRDEGGLDNWGEVTKITASDGAEGDRFGNSVAISGDTAIVGAIVGDDNEKTSGSAYVYGRDVGGIDNWGEATKITASDGAAGDQFGFSVSISGDTAIVGARLDDDSGAESGSAYVYFAPPETIGGAIYTDCDVPLINGEEDVDVTISGPRGIFMTTTSGPSGTWHIPDIPIGEYTVTPHQVFREYCHVDIGGDCPPEPCETSSHITVDADHRSENLSIQFLGQPSCIVNDLNYDEACTIVFDTNLFVQCVYGGDCVGPEGQDLQCPADCNCDGLATIVFDASCFMHDVYVKGVCGTCPDDGPANASERQRTANGFTIGGAVYDDAANPLLSGIEGVGVQVFGVGRKTVATATTAGASGIWRVDGLSAGKYSISFEGRNVIRILVNDENEAANLSLRLLRSHVPARRRD